MTRTQEILEEIGELRFSGIKVRDGAQSAVSSWEFSPEKLATYLASLEAKVHTHCGGPTPSTQTSSKIVQGGTCPSLEEKIEKK